MKTVKLPKTSSIIDSITFEDAGIFPDYYIDRTNDHEYYNEEHRPVIRLQEPVYNANKYQAMIDIKEEARKLYEDWISKAPWFIDVNVL